MTDFIFHLLPWWGWAVIAIPIAFVAFKYLGFNGTIAVIAAGLAATIYAKGRKTGAAVEVEKQHKADDHARDVIHETKEDVRSIPNTPAGKAERNDRFDRWVKK